MGRSLNTMRLRQCLNPQQLAAIREQVDAVHVSESLLDYLQRIVARTRQTRKYVLVYVPTRVAFAALVGVVVAASLGGCGAGSLARRRALWSSPCRDGSARSSVT